MNRQTFFDAIRTSLFGMLSNGQVSGIDAILDAWQSDQRLRGNDPYAPAYQLASLAYVLATTQLETDKTMQAIKEYGGPAYYHRMYDIEGDRPHKAKELGNCHPGDGALFPGRGCVMITGRDNYIRMGEKLGIDLVGNPDLAMVPENSARIIVLGMADGDFTGHKLADYFNEEGFDFVGARYIVNGKDRAITISQFAVKYLAALELAMVPEVVEPVPSPADAMDYTPPAQYQQPTPAPAQQQPVPQAKRPAPDHVWTDPVTGERIESWNAEADSPGAFMPTAAQRNFSEAKAAVEAEAEKPKGMDKLSGWKTHIGMIISGAIGIAAMFGFIPNMDAETGAQMLQAAFGVSGFRSGIPKIIQMGIIFYLKNKATR